MLRLTRNLLEELLVMTKMSEIMQNGDQRVDVFGNDD